jgi:outer membrane protein assembly factor BamB
VVVRTARQATVAALAIAAAGCLPDQRGACSTDLDCGGGSSGLFCAEGVCQGAPRGYFSEVPRTIFGRADTATVRIRVDRAHGGAAVATASLRLNGQSVAGVREPDGRVRFDVPLQLASPGVEAAVRFDVAIRDDLGHETTISETLFVDDLAPRLFIDADTVPSRAVLRGNTVQLRAHVVDGTAVKIITSPGVTVTSQVDGSYLLVLDTRALDPAATLAQVALGATDVAGNTSSTSIQFPLTRVRWQSTTSAVQAAGLAITAERVVASRRGTDSTILNRADGSVVTTVSLAAAPFGNLATNGVSFITARVDGFVSSFTATGAQRWSCYQFGTLNAGPALGTFASNGAEILAAIVVGGGTSTTFDQRLFGLRDDRAVFAASGTSGSCTSTNAAVASAQLTSVNFDQGGTSIGTDGSIYAGALQALVHAAFDGVSWGPATVTALGSRVMGPPAVVRSATAVQIAVVSGMDGQVDAIAFPGGRVTGFPVQASGTFQFAATPPTIAEDGTVTVGSDDRRVAAISPAGTVRWHTTIAAPATTPPTHGTGGILYVGTTAGIVALQLQDGRILWTFATRGAVRTAPALGCDGVLYFGDDSGAVTALQTDSASLADSAWPRGGHDDHGTGDARHALRAADGSCVE